MKKKFPCLCGCMLAFLLFSCQTTETNEIDLSKPAGTITQKFSDMADNLRAIPLETSDSCLLSSNLGVWVGNKYIITADRESRHLFVKTASTSGNWQSKAKGRESSTLLPRSRWTRPRNAFTTAIGVKERNYG